MPTIARWPLREGPDGSLYITDDAGGRIWRVLYVGGAAAQAAGNVPCSGVGGGAAGLVAAVNAANASGGGAINLASGCTYSLTSANNTLPGVGTNGLPVITAPITINGRGGATIAGNNSNFRIIAISGAAGGSLTLNGITVTGGNVSGDGPAGFGGGIFNFAGTLLLNRSVVTGNTASNAGGGIASGTMGPGPGATLTLNNSEVSSNTVPPSGMGGGGILNIAGTLDINNSTIDHNSGSGGGGIASGNGNGGGPGSPVTISNSVISDNSATGGEEKGGAGISNGGTLQMNNTQLSGNDADGGFGGGLLNHGTATLNNVKATGNSAGIGAGIANANLQGIPEGTPPVPALTMNNGNVTGNTASVAGGGIANFSPFGAPLGCGHAAQHAGERQQPQQLHPGRLDRRLQRLRVRLHRSVGRAESEPGRRLTRHGDRDGDVGHTHQRDDHQRQLRRPHDGDDRVAYPLLRHASR